MRHFFILTVLIPAIGGIGGALGPVRDTGSCIGNKISGAVNRIEKRGLMPQRDIKLVARDIGRCF